MSTTQPHLSMALGIVSSYDGALPFHLYLKKYFQQNRRCGSRDRRQIRALCYAWFRCNGLLSGVDPVERMRLSLYLVSECRDTFYDRITCYDDALPSPFKPEEPFAEKLDTVCRLTGRKPEDAFPLWSEVSSQIEPDGFLHNLFIQPRVWLRARSAHLTDVEAALKDAGIPFAWNPYTPCALSVPPETPLDALQLAERGWAEVQDLSSQRTVSFMHASHGEHWYDACAASGGKSLLLKDVYPDIELTVSDNRETILRNLEERFRRNGYAVPRLVVCDLIRDDPPFDPSEPPDGIIADVPCSGSGTWSRTPERLTFFDREELEGHVQVQQAISQRLARLLKPGGRLVYITCSVYARENETRVHSLCSSEGMQLLAMSYLQGSSERADTLFCAELVKS